MRATWTGDRPLRYPSQAGGGIGGSHDSFGAGAAGHGTSGDGSGHSAIEEQEVGDDGDGGIDPEQGEWG